MLKKYFLAGLLVWLPIMATIFVIHLILSALNSIVNILPEQYEPAYLFGIHVPGLGIVVALIIILITGVIAHNFFGHKLLDWAERLVAKIPFIRTIYSGTKQILETLMSAKGESFRKVLLVEYPRKGLWSIAFQAGNGQSQINAQLGREMVTVFIPTTPNPTSGFLFLAYADEVIELKMPVEDALKFVVSLGTIGAHTEDHSIHKPIVNP